MKDWYGLVSKLFDAGYSVDFTLSSSGVPDLRIRRMAIPLFSPAKRVQVINRTCGGVSPRFLRGIKNGKKKT